MNCTFCCPQSYKLRNALNELVGELDGVHDPHERGNTIRRTLESQWNRIFPQHVENEGHNRRFLAKKIEHFLIQEHIDGSPHNRIVRYIQDVQNSLRIIHNESSTQRFKDRFNYCQMRVSRKYIYCFKKQPTDLSF